MNDRSGNYHQIVVWPWLGSNSLYHNIVYSFIQGTLPTQTVNLYPEEPLDWKLYALNKTFPDGVDFTSLVPAAVFDKDMIGHGPVRIHFFRTFSDTEEIQQEAYEREAMRSSLVCTTVSSFIIFMHKNETIGDGLMRVSSFITRKNFTNIRLTFCVVGGPAPEITNDMIENVSTSFQGMGKNWNVISIPEQFTVDQVTNVFATSLVPPAATMSLTVTAHSARDLMAADSNGKSDPFVKIHLMKYSQVVAAHKTKYIPKTLNPRWTSKHNNSVTWRIKREDCAALKIYFEVWDDDLVGADFLGQFMFDLNYGRDIREQDLELKPREAKKKDKGISGSLNISLQWKEG